jgi:glycine oxidase
VTLNTIATVYLMSVLSAKFDAAIIGGGVIGCAIAWRLAQSGMNVAVIERGEPGGEASFAAGGMLAPLAEADRADDFFRLCVESCALYASFADELRQVTGIDIEYRTEGTLYLSLTESDDEELERRWQWQHAAGLNVKKLSAECVHKLEPQINSSLRWALKFPDDHQVNNRRLMAALMAAARAAGAHLLTSTEAVQLLTESRAGQRHVTGIRTSEGEIRTPTVVLAAGSWSGLLNDEQGNRAARFNVKPVRGQMIALQNPVPPVSHVIYSRRAYLVPRLNGIVIAGSTSEQAGYDKSVTASGLTSIIERAAEIAPALRAQAVRETWAGLRPKGPDNKPILGTEPAINGLVYATGHYRNGILLTPITARAISELIRCGQSSVDIATFSVTHKAVRPAFSHPESHSPLSSASVPQN